MGKESNGPTYFGNLRASRASHKISTANTADSGAGTDIQFRDADIRSVIDALLGDALKLNYTVDPAIQGKITLHTSAALTKEALLPALESALLSVSAAIVKQGAMYHVVPLDAAPQKAHGINRWGFNRAVGPGFGIDIYPLHYIAVTEMQKLVETIFPKGTILQANPIHNYLVVAGTSQDRLSIQQVIENFDVDTLQETRFALYPIAHTTPQVLIGELKEIFQPPLDVINQRVRLVALERLQSILGIANDQSDLEVMENWIKRLDTANP